MRGQTAATRTFWWDRTPDADVQPLRAVIFDLDAIIDTGDDGQLAAPDGLIDVVMSLFVTGVWVGVVGAGTRAEVEPLVRELLGDGLVETIVTGDDTESADRTELYNLALWEFGIDPQCALAVPGSDAGLYAAIAAGVAVVESTDDIRESGSTAECQRLHRRWWADRKRTAAA